MKGSPILLDKAVRDGMVFGRFSVPVGPTQGAPKIISVSATGAAVGFGTAVLSGLPAGFLNILEVACSLTFTAQDSNLIATWNGDFSLGSVPTADNDLADSGEADIVASTALGPAVAGVFSVSRVGIAGGGPVRLDNSGGGLELNLNMLVDAASIVDDTTAEVAVTGNVDLLMGWV